MVGVLGLKGNCGAWHNASFFHVAAEDLARCKCRVVVCASNNTRSEDISKRIINSCYVTLRYTVTHITELNRRVKLFLSKESKLVHHRELRNTFETVSFHNFANWSFQQIASRREPSLAVAVVKFKQLIESRFSDLNKFVNRNNFTYPANTLVVFPSCKHRLHPLPKLSFFHIAQQD